MTLEEEATEMNETLYAILLWDIDNVIPHELSQRAKVAIRPQLAQPAALGELKKIIADLVDAIWQILNSDTEDRIPMEIRKHALAVIIAAGH